jgi:tetratricopeptide (TPR) repeat protein
LRIFFKVITLADERTVLGLNPQATLPQVEDAYAGIMKFYGPEAFSGYQDGQIRACAEAISRRIGDAYLRLTTSLCSSAATVPPKESHSAPVATAASLQDRSSTARMASPAQGRSSSATVPETPVSPQPLPANKKNNPLKRTYLFGDMPTDSGQDGGRSLTQDFAIVQSAVSPRKEDYTSIGFYLVEAHHHLQDWRNEDAIRDLQYALTIDAENVEAKVLLYTAQARQLKLAGEEAQAMALYQAALELDETHDEARQEVRLYVEHHRRPKK